MPYYNEEKKAFMLDYILAARKGGRSVDDKSSHREELINTAEDLYRRALKTAEVDSPPKEKTAIVGTIHVGVAIIVKDSMGRVLVGKRLGKHGYGTWCPPGGHLEFGETIEGCVKRELWEETGMVATSVTQITTISDVLTEVVGKQYITIWVEATVDTLEPKNTEPDKCAGWEFHDLFEIPQPRFLAVVNYLNDIAARNGL